MKKIMLILLILLMSGCDGMKRTWDRCDVFEDSDNPYPVHTYYDVLAQKKGHMWLLWTNNNENPLSYEEQYIYCIDIPSNRVKVETYNPVFRSYWNVSFLITNGYDYAIQIDSIEIVLKNTTHGEFIRETVEVDIIVEPRSYEHVKIDLDNTNLNITEDESRELDPRSVNVLIDFTEQAAEDKFYVAGRPKGLNGNSFLIGDQEMLKGYVWVEITDDTDTTNTVFGQDDWTDYWRERYKVEIDRDSIDMSTYPYKVEAKSVTIEYREDGITGVVASLDENFFILSGFYHNLLYVSIDENTVVDIDNYDGTLDSIMSLGDIVHFKYEILLESYPGQTTATEIISVEEFILPDNIVEKYGPDVVFVGMYGNENGTYPVFRKVENDCSEEVFEYDGYYLNCMEIKDLIVIQDNIVITLLDAFELGILHPSDFEYDHLIHFYQ